MTDDEAQAEAERLYGPEAFARDRTLWFGYDSRWPRYAIERDSISFAPPTPLGEGDSWEAAFADAQRETAP